MASGVGVKIEGLRVLQEKMRKAAEAAPRELDRAVLRGALLVAGQAQRNVTGGFSGASVRGAGSGGGLRVRTGRLRQSIGVSLLSPGVARVGTNVIYAAIHEFGGTTRPHFILPKRPGGVLAWRAQGPSRRRGGPPMQFARIVYHPGSNIPARPYMRPALELMRPRVIAEIRKVYAGPLGLGEVGRG